MLLQIHLHCDLTGWQERKKKALRVTNRLRKKQQIHRSREKMLANRRIRSTNAFIRILYAAEKVIHSQIEWVHCSRFHDLHTNTKSTFCFADAGAGVVVSAVVERTV